MKLLLDSHVPAAVIAALKKLRPSLDVQHVSRWQAGVWKDAEDHLLLEALWTDHRVLVSRDRRTLPLCVARRVAEGKSHAGILFFDAERFPAQAIGSLARALVKAIIDQPEDWTDRWVTLR